ncbi:DUF5947 family protein [Streptomyces sp. WMMB 322]|uniref:DUF5947 family protein n=1 Tax=Streptomyces sp. WMMB 322 TaxID=1286821 RepID=UPI001586C66E|nr:DUF5947 family protein [Streptomyces sp. WMMB 322]
MSGAAPGVPGGRLRALLERPRAGGTPGSAGASAAAGAERCDLCAEQVPESHRHLLDVQESSVLCACGPCALLFGQSTAGGRHYKLLPDRRARLDGFRIDAMLWARLRVPVGLAFFVRDGASGEVGVGYPSPLGVTRSAVEPEVWEELTRGYPELAELADDVEALLVHRSDGADEHWIVPLDDCYRLAAVVRTHWRGLSGGPEVREHLDAFFAGLAGRSAKSRTSGTAVLPSTADEPRSQHG